MAQPAVPLSGYLSPEARAKLQQIETHFIYGQLRKALWISYEHLLGISERLESSFTTELPDLPHGSQFEQNGAHQQGMRLHLLVHRCPGTAQCDCEQFLSLTAQFLNKLKYSSAFVEAFLRQFYGVEPLPLLCVGLLAGLWVNKGRLKDAQHLIEDCGAALRDADGGASSTAGVGLGTWDDMDVTKYLHLVSLQVTHVLLPQGLASEARALLHSTHAHPKAVLPLDPTLVYNLTQMIDHHEELNRFSNEQFAQAQVQAEAAAPQEATAPAPAQQAVSKPGAQPSTWETVFAKLKARATRHRAGIAAGVGLFAIVLLVRAVYRRRKTTVYPAVRRFWHEVMELLDSAFSVNFGFSRIQRRQRRQQILQPSSGDL